MWICGEKGEPKSLGVAGGGQGEVRDGAESFRRYMGLGS